MTANAAAARDRTAGQPAPDEADGGRRTRRVPFWHLLAGVAGSLLLIPGAGPVKDIDVYWHVRMGELILRTRSVPTTEPWNFPAVGRDWVPHSWLSEVVMALSHRLGGWGGVVALRLVLGAALLALVGRHLLRAGGPVSGPVTYVVAAVALAYFVYDRPQLFALVLVAALLPMLERARSGVAPPLLAAAALGWLWASLHGSWPLLPGVLALCAAGVVADRGRAALPDARKLVTAAAVAVVGAALTPVGPSLLARPFVVSRAVSSGIAEWQPTVLWSPLTVPFVLLVMALVYTWTRADDVPRSELLWAGVMVLAALNAHRNLGFATLLIAPLVARRLPRGSASTVPAWTVRAAAGAAAAVVVALSAANPDLPTDAPTSLMETLRAAPGQARVLNNYNIGGYVTGFGGDEVSAAIDGRVDAYPPGFLDRYLEMERARGDWDALIAELKPTHALLDIRTALPAILERDRGWRRLGEQEPFVLLEAP